MLTKTEVKILLWSWLGYWCQTLEGAIGVLTFGFAGWKKPLWTRCLEREIHYIFQYVRETGKQPRF